MTHYVQFAITNAAQKAAAKLGLPAAAVQAYPLPPDLHARALELGANVKLDGSVVLIWGTTWSGKRAYGVDAWRVLNTLPTSAEVVLDAIEVKLEARAVAEVAETALLEGPDDDLVVYDPEASEFARWDLSPAVAELQYDSLTRQRARKIKASRNQADVDQADLALLREPVEDHYDVSSGEIELLINSKFSAVSRRARAAGLRVLRERKERREAKRRAVFTAAVTELGTDGQLAAWEAGILAQREVIALLDGAVGGELENVLIHAADPDDESWSDIGVMTLGTAEATKLLEIRAALERLSGTLGSLSYVATEVGIVRQTEVCEEEDYDYDAEPAVRYAILIKVVIGGEIALDTYTVLLAASEGS